MSTDNAAEDWLRTFQMQQEVAQSESRQRLAACCESLAALGADTVRIEYDGYGDSGSVETVRAFAGEREIPLAAALVESLDDAVCALLPLGWENDEGGFGEVVIDLPGRTITRDHHYRFTRCEHEQEAFTL